METMQSRHEETEVNILGARKKYLSGSFFKETDYDTPEQMAEISRMILPNLIKNRLIKVQELAGNATKAKECGLSYLQTLYPERNYSELPIMVLFESNSSNLFSAPSTSISK